MPSYLRRAKTRRSRVTRQCARVMSALITTAAAVLTINASAPTVLASGAFGPPGQEAAQSPTSGNGKVVATIVVEGLRIPAVSVELRDVDANIVIAKTTSDEVGQVTFPDVPSRRYVLHAVRDGFADTTSAPFTVRPGGTE